MQVILETYMKGEIYIITNDVNSKVYIGQTIQGIEKRFYQHKLLAKHNGKTKLATAMREIGDNHFKIDIICKSEQKQLTRLETHYIEKFNSIQNGYNSVIPVGDVQSNKYECIAEKIEEIISDYLNGITYNKICERYSISRNYLAEICKGLSDLRIEVEYNSYNEAKVVIAYDISFEPIKRFESINEALKFVIKLGYNSDKRNFYNYINAACQKGNIAYGYRWQLESDIIYNNKRFRTKFDKEAYINGGIAYQPENKDYWIVDKSLVVVKGFKENNVKVAKDTAIPHFIKVCSICGDPIDKNATLCIKCYNKKKSANIPDRDELSRLIEHSSYEEIGRKFNVTGKAVRKWCDKYGISKGTRQDNNGVYCIELRLKFDTFKEAAIFLVNNKYISSNNIGSIGYNISLAKKNNKEIYGLHWE